MSLLWVAFFVVVALFVAAIVAKILRAMVRGGQQAPRSERPWD